MSNKLKEIILLVIVIVCLFYVYDQYRIDQNQPPLQLNSYSLWLSFDRNITQVKDLDMTLDYTSKLFTFTSSFIPSSRNVVFEVEASHFNQKNRCDVQLQELGLDGTEEQSWVVNKYLNPITMKNDPRNTTLLLKGTCLLDNAIPNGFLQAQVSNQSKSISISNTTLNVYFDDLKYECRENCLYNDQLHNVDGNGPAGIHNAVMKGNDITDARNLQFSLRTSDKETANMVEIWFALFIGFIFFAIQIGYDIYKEVSISGLFLKLCEKIQHKK